MVYVGVLVQWTVWVCGIGGEGVWNVRYWVIAGCWAVWEVWTVR